MIYEYIAAVCAVEYLRHRASSSLIIYESLGAVCAVESVRHPCQQVVDDL